MATPVPLASRMYLLPILPSGDDRRRQTGLFGEVAELDADRGQVGFHDSRRTWDAVAAPHSLKTVDATPSEHRNQRSHHGELPGGQQGGQGAAV